VRYLITGGAGFIGSHLTEALLDRGDEVTVLDDCSTGATIDTRAEFVAGSVLDKDLVEEEMFEADRCFHLAAALGVQRVLEHPLDCLLSNVRGVDVLTEAAAKAGTRLMFASTSEVYGKPTEGEMHEGDDRLYGPATTSRWAYSAAKAVGEMMTFGYARERFASQFSVRFFNVCGPRQDEMVIPTMVKRSLAGEKIQIHGDGRQTRCFCHVFDAVEALTLLMDDERAVGTVYNIGNPTEITIGELAQKVISMTGGPGVEYVHPDYGDGFEEIRRRKPSIDAISSLTGWRPERTVDDAIKDVIAWEAVRAAQ
jgi:UDP-glucose 4-epimerase